MNIWHSIAMENIKNDVSNTPEKKGGSFKRYARRGMLYILGTLATLGATDKAMSAEKTADEEFLKGGKDKTEMVDNKEKSDKNEFIKNLETGSDMIKKANEALQMRIDDITSDLSVLEKQNPLPFKQIAIQKENKKKLLELQFREGGIDESVYQAEIDKLSE
jgi:hypothetical protein